jgi:hypothetical protein
MLYDCGWKVCKANHCSFVVSATLLFVRHVDRRDSLSEPYWILCDNYQPQFLFPLESFQPPQMTITVYRLLQPPSSPSFTLVLYIGCTGRTFDAIQTKGRDIVPPSHTVRNIWNITFARSFYRWQNLIVRCSRQPVSANWKNFTHCTLMWSAITKSYSLTETEQF